MMSKQFIDSLKALLLAALVVGAGSGAARADTLSDILQAGVVRIGVPQDFPPFGVKGADGELHGYDIEVARSLARALEVRLELVPVSSVNRIPWLLTGKVDLVISSLGVDPRRAKAIAFSTPYAPFFSGIFGAPDSAVSRPGDLRGRTVAVTRDTLEDRALERIAPEGAQILRYEDNNATITAFVTGEAELIATGNVVVASMVKSNPNRRIESRIVLRNSPSSIGVRRSDPDLLRWVNTFLYYVKLNGDLDRLSLEWFGEPLPALPTL